MHDEPPKAAECPSTPAPTSAGPEETPAFPAGLHTQTQEQASDQFVGPLSLKQSDNTGCTQDERVKVDRCSTPEGPDEAPAFPAGFYTQQASSTQPVGPLSLEQALQQQPDSAGDLWYCDGQHTWGPYTREQLAAYQDTERPSLTQAVHGFLDPEEQQLSSLAQSLGTSLRDVVAFCHSSSRAPADQPQQPVEDQDFDADLPEQPAAESTKSGPRQPCRGWRKLAKRKRERKARQRTAWLK